MNYSETINIEGLTKEQEKIVTDIIIKHEGSNISSPYYNNWMINIHFDQFWVRRLTWDDIQWFKKFEDVVNFLNNYFKDY